MRPSPIQRSAGLEVDAARHGERRVAALLDGRRGQGELLSGVGLHFRRRWPGAWVRPRRTRAANASPSGRRRRLPGTAPPHLGRPPPAMRSGRMEEDELAGQRPQPGGAGRRTHILLNGDVEVRAAEAERAHRCPARIVFPPHPRPCLAVEIERRLLVDVEPLAGHAHLARLREHLVVQRHHGLDQPSRPGGRLGVTDLRLDRARARILVALRWLLEDVTQGLELGKVAGLGPVPCASTSPTVSGP